jgi:hypothetical protein
MIAERAPRKHKLFKDLKILKAVYDKPRANVKLNGEKLKPLLVKSGMRQVPTIPTYIQHSTGIPSQSNLARRRDKWNTNR